MIIGNGLIASLFNEYDKENVVFFASGVSNSSETRREEFLREENLIQKILSENPKKIFVYFSTCSIYDSSKNESPYVNHKLKMEQIVAYSSQKYLILRVSNAVGKGGNPNLLMNHLVHTARSGETINVHTLATRNLIDVEDIRKITLQLIEQEYFNKIINVAYLHNYSVIEILELLERFFLQKAVLNLIKKGQSYSISTPDVTQYFKENQLTDKDTYLLNILKKYYYNEPT
ncbi:MAG: NAD-dependent epimerase/dehydratase family protein [Cloacibacterium sp.]|nr:NAD-dependent epimerase/dehydratase family protein [Cloacibacterium sp.]